MQWTTRSGTGTDETGAETTIFSNRLLERSGHPYAKALLELIQQPDRRAGRGRRPMNGPYMMLSPEIRKNCGLWDRLFFDSVQGRDVQSRIIWETRATYEAAKRWLERDEPVRLEGRRRRHRPEHDARLRQADPRRIQSRPITATITDRDHANIDKANRLLDTLATTRDEKLRSIGAAASPPRPKTSSRAKPAEGAADDERYDVVTAIGILEYFQGFSYTTTEQRLRIAEQAESATAHDLIARLTRNDHRPRQPDREHLPG